MKWTSSAMAREGGSGDSYTVDINSYITHSMWRTVGNKYQSPYFTQWFFSAFGLLPDHFTLHSTLKVVSGTNSGST